MISSKNSWRPNNCKNAEREFSPSLRVRSRWYISGLQSNYTCLNCTELPLCCTYCLPCFAIPSHPSVVHGPPFAPPSHCCFSQEGVLGALSILILASRGESCNESPSIAVLPGTGTLPFLMKLSAVRTPQRKGGERAGCAGSGSISSGARATPRTQDHQLCS